MRRSLGLSAIFALVLLAASCGGDDTASPVPTAPSADGSTQTDPGQSGTDAGSSGATAVVTVGDSTYELTSPQGCGNVGGNTILASFADGADTVSLTSADGVVLVRMSLDGVDWVDSGGPPPPVITATGATWTGQVAEFPNGGATPVNATIDLAC